MACSCSCPGIRTCHASPHLHQSPSPSSSPPASPPPPLPPAPNRSLLRGRRECLEEIYTTPAYRFQLELWQAEEEAFQSVVDLKQEKCRTLQNEMYQLFGMYFMFQGVMFTAVAQSNTLTCADRWKPFSLSFTASLATICAVIQKLVNIAKMKVDLQQAKDRANAVYDKIDDMKMKGLGLNLNDEPESALTGKIVEGRVKGKISGYGIAVIGFLLSFSAFILVSCLKVLCRGCTCRSS